MSGVTLQEFHTYNGIFTANEYTNHIAQRRKCIRFGGARNEQHNYVAERDIKNIVYMGCMLLIHVAMQIPEGVNCA